MSCCSNCAQSKPCCGSASPNWSLPALLSGLNGVDALAAGSMIRVGFNVRTAYGTPEDDPATLELKIMSCLYSTGLFDNVDAVFSSGYLKDYVTVSARTLIDFSQAEDAAGNITEVIKNCAPRVTLLNRDPVVIDSIPEEQANTPGIQQPNYRRYENQYRGTPNAPKKDCWNSTNSWTDYLACEMGVTPSTAVVTGIVIALVGVVAFKKVVL